MRARAAQSVFAMATALLSESSAWAEPARAALVWTERASACMEPRALERSVEAILGRPVFVHARPDLVVEGAFEPRPGRWAAALRMRRADGTVLGTREIESPAPACQSMDESLALVVALMVDVPRDEVVAQAPAEPWRADVALATHLGLGLVPGLQTAGRVSVAIDPPAFFPVEIEGIAGLPSRAVLASGGGVDVSALEAGLALCPLAWARGRLSGRTCAGGEVLRLRATGFGFDESYDRSVFEGALALRQRLEVRLAGPLALDVGAGASVPIEPHRFEYQLEDGSVRPLYARSPVVGFLEVGIALGI